MTTYRVSGDYAFRGTESGDTFEADSKDPQIVRAVTRGSITEEKATPANPKNDTGKAGAKEKN